MSVIWTCHRSGDCCRTTSHVTMTPQEASGILARRPDLLSRFRRPTNSRFWYLEAAPCPLLDPETSACAVYDIRPYNCRRYACGRASKDEPFVADGWVTRAKNDRAFRRYLELVQRKAQRWARRMGWTE